MMILSASKLFYGGSYTLVLFLDFQLKYIFCWMIVSMQCISVGFCGQVTVYFFYVIALIMILITSM